MTSASDDTLLLGKRALRCVCANLPHLVELAYKVELIVDKRVSTAAVTPGGRVLLNPDWYGTLDLADATFVMAHELLHLAFRHHQRFTTAQDRRMCNIAADCVINDMLCEELRLAVPRGGYALFGARHLSLEQVLERLKTTTCPEMYVWRTRYPKKAPPEETQMEKQLREAGLAPERKVSADNGEVPDENDGPDLIDEETEQEWFPQPLPQKRARLEEMKEAADRVTTTAKLLKDLSTWERGDSPGFTEQSMEALKIAYTPPWEMALQKWIENQAPSGRTWARASRRPSPSPEIALPGRSRQGWTLNLVIDTSGSMYRDLPYLLGLLSGFCRSANVEDVRIVQCDVQVTVDERVTPEDLTDYKVKGFGGSDMTPAMLQLAEDPQVESVIVLTDGMIGYPAAPPPYRVLWGLTRKHYSEFAYGAVLHLTAPSMRR